MELVCVGHTLCKFRAVTFKGKGRTRRRRKSWSSVTNLADVEAKEGKSPVALLHRSAKFQSGKTLTNWLTQGSVTWKKEANEKVI